MPVPTALRAVEKATQAAIEAAERERQRVRKEMVWQMDRADRNEAKVGAVRKLVGRTFPHRDNVTPCTPGSWDLNCPACWRDRILRALTKEN